MMGTRDGPERPTLADMIETTTDWLWLWCPRCHYNRAVRLADYAEVWGGGASTDLLRRQSRCSQCGHVGALTTTPSWKNTVVGFAAFPTDEDEDRMCNLYSMTKSRSEVAKLFGVGDNRAASFEPKDAIFPGHPAPVIVPVDGDRELRVMSWGFILPMPGKAPRRVTNTRDDKVLGSRFWTPSFKERRCLVPASSFCEPHDGRTPATWHWFALKGDEPRPLFAFAGIWRQHKGPIKRDDPEVEIETFSFMTTMPNAATQSINHERSPVLLTTEDEWRIWTEGTPEAAMKLVKPIAAERLHIVQEGFDKRDRLGK